ncbi:ArsR/SmtB family transcription factor [Brassicibacter mesophilus]|uniref:ArsR/SmtB family transcription factor n=1 Tax=Brassicibacter mesophilus TaxID=745119 RepID=UPI003D1B487F
MNELTNLFKVLSDETRLRIIMLLANKELCVCEICGITGLSQPNVSKHLSKLRDIGLVKDERKGQFISYYLDSDDMLFKKIIQSISDNIEKYPVLKGDLEKIVDANKYLSLCKK